MPIGWSNYDPNDYDRPIRKRSKEGNFDVKIFTVLFFIIIALGLIYKNF